MDFLQHAIGYGFEQGLVLGEIDWSVPYDEKISVMLRLGLAALMGALLGWERGLRSLRIFER